MNRTLTNASLRAGSALWLRSGAAVCWSCSLTYNCSQRLQHQSLIRSVRPRPSAITSSVGYATSSYQQKHPQFTAPGPPPVGGDQPSTRHELEAERRNSVRQERIKTEQARLHALAKKPRNPSRVTTKSKGHALRPAESGLVSPEKAGLYKLPRRPRKKKPSVGPPKSKKKDKAVYISGSSLLKNYSPDLSVEWPDGIPPCAPIQCDHERVPIKYKYFIRRTKSNRLPVYNEAGRGGSLQITQIQRVEGDPRELLLELERSLEVPLDKISYNPLTRRVVIKMGRLKHSVSEVLTRLGF